MLKFIPYDDLSEVASDAYGIQSLDFGHIMVGESNSESIRIGNTCADAVTYSLSVPANFAEWIEVAPESGSLQGDYISDTTVIVVAPPLDALTETHAVDLTATTNDGKTYNLELTFTAVGANELRQRQYPERRTAFTDNVSGVIMRVSEILNFYRYDPIAYNPNDRRVIIDVDQFRRLTGEPGAHRWISQENVAERLSPTNATWGYTRSEEIAWGTFQEETTDVQVTFTKDNSMMTYTSTAFLVLPAEVEPTNIWALFAPANDPDPATYKRTVYLFQRQGDVWALHNIYARYRGNELSHYEVQLIQLHRQAMGSAAFYNPFAFVYERDTDKPYAMYPVDYDDLFVSLGDDTSGSNV